MKSKITLGILAVFSLSVGLSLFISQKQQDLRTRAAPASRLYFSPQATLLKPIEKKVGEDISLDVMIDPGNNNISLLRLLMEYNTTAFEATGKNTFVLNTEAFPAIMEGPIIDIDNGVIFVTLSVGSDRAKAIRKITKIGRINLKAKQSVNLLTSTVIFDNRSAALSVGANDHAYENVIGSTEPAYIAVLDGQPTEPPSDGNPGGGPGIITPTLATTPTITPTPSPIPPTYAPLPTGPTPTPRPNDTILLFEAFLHGIGSAGDNLAPDKNSLSNKKPKNLTRNIRIDILTSTNQPVITKNGLAIYDSESGSFKGTINLGDNFTTGNYIVKIKAEGYLRQQLPKVQIIKASSQNQLVMSSLTTGDVNDDNTLNILDFNLLTTCFSPTKNTSGICDPTTNKTKDLTDDLNIDHLDYNLFLREISSLIGK